jgi:hypothetical protein
VEAQIPNLINTWTIPQPFKYVVYTALLSLAVRVLSSCLKALEISRAKTFLDNAVRIFGGFHSDKTMRDFWFPFLLGWAEIAGFAVLMRTGAWLLIGAWLTFKTLGQWDHWKEHRPAFNRFLIGNAAVLIISLWVAKNFVS